ncbi:MAG: hypothetical protein ACERKN_07215 [Velocimicrobium sp.]
MSKVVISKNICDRCGKELRYPRMHIMRGKKNKVETLASRETWGDGYPIDKIIDLCYECAKEFDSFMDHEVAR